MINTFLVNKYTHGKVGHMLVVSLLCCDLLASATIVIKILPGCHKTNVKLF